MSDERKELARARARIAKLENAVRVLRAEIVDWRAFLCVDRACRIADEALDDKPQRKRKAASP